MRLKKHLTYSARTEWDNETGGTAQIQEFTQKFDTPLEYGGNGSAPCPDQLFMASLGGCIINTFNYYRNMLDVSTLDLRVNVSSDIVLTDLNGYRVTGISIDIQVWSDVDNLELNQKCAERARDYCHLTKSIEDAIPIETSINSHIK